MLCLLLLFIFFFFKQKTAYEMRISDWSSDVCSSDLEGNADRALLPRRQDHRDLRGHQRNPAPGHRPPRNRAALSDASHPQDIEVGQNRLARRARPRSPRKQDRRDRQGPPSSIPARSFLSPARPQHLIAEPPPRARHAHGLYIIGPSSHEYATQNRLLAPDRAQGRCRPPEPQGRPCRSRPAGPHLPGDPQTRWQGWPGPRGRLRRRLLRSEEHTSELQSLMRISYAVFCL